MVIKGVRCTHYHLPREALWPLPLEDTTISVDSVDLVACEVQTRSGVAGLGYTYTLSGGGSAAFALLADEIAPVILGSRLERPEPIWDALWSRMHRYGRGGLVSVALAASDIALWDTCARAAGLPLYRFLGAARDRVAAYGSSVDLGYTCDELVEAVGNWVERGFTAVKVKVGRALEDDLVRLAAVRRHIGASVKLMVDANGGWELADAVNRTAAMARFDLTWIEEPLSPDALDDYVALAAQTVTPLAAGESLFSVAEFARYIDAGAIHFIQADVGRVGGVTPWLRVAEFAATRGLPMAPHFMHDVHVHLLCSIPNPALLEYLPLLDAVLESSLVVEEGFARPPERPGHGIVLAADILERHVAASVALGALPVRAPISSQQSSSGAASKGRLQ